MTDPPDPSPVHPSESVPDGGNGAPGGLGDGGADAQGSPTPPPRTPLSPDAGRAVPEGWVPLGARTPDRLRDARLQLHHLAQIPAAFGGTLVRHEDDDSHRALTWSPGLGGFRSRSADLAGNVFMVVRPLPLEVQIRAVGDVHRYVLPGHTLQEAWDWAETELSLILGREQVELSRPEFEIPSHRVAAHALFDASPLDLEELARWFDDGRLLLEEVRSTCRERASPVLSWPHHFDMATLLDFGAGPDGERRTVGVGLSPGDETREAPYLYVAPWPRPDTAPDHELPAGCWQEIGWVGAVLPAEELMQGSAERQEARARAFVEAALSKARELVA